MLPENTTFKGRQLSLFKNAKVLKKNNMTPQPQFNNFHDFFISGLLGR